MGKGWKKSNWNSVAGCEFTVDSVESKTVLRISLERSFAPLPVIDELRCADPTGGWEAVWHRRRTGPAMARSPAACRRRLGIVAKRVLCSWSALVGGKKT